nr:splicing regulatory glutamine/lysine-rich protein 1 [Ipomoea batatas]GMD90002.1 splicing regulatory glutamine/lysine-rich protein 1 [Ipomoea batatas]GMD92317.1 splicing regulatory glutamine/lysine-rich protein 1 [Ipomoea batatas]GMD93621.1 splicing regulatory glutamine/lysine-rich protein 1 [Ipomoea batatas]
MIEIFLLAFSCHSSSDTEHEAGERHKKHKHRDRSSKKKEKDRGKSHKSKRRKHKAKEKQEVERHSSPVQLSKFLGRDKDDGVRRSAVSGKKVSKFISVYTGLHNNVLDIVACVVFNCNLALH